MGEPCDFLLQVFLHGLYSVHQFWDRGVDLDNILVHLQVEFGHLFMISKKLIWTFIYNSQIL